jgi:hypothetical protein
MTGFPTWDGQAIDPDLLPNYGYNDPVTYGGYTLPRYLSYMLAGLNEIGVVIDENAGLMVGASASNVSVGTGAKSFTATTNRAWAPGMYLLAYASADNFVSGTVTSYNPATGALVLNSVDTGGSGSYTSWTITLSGKSLPTSRWYTGAGAPSGSLGSDFDLYLNTTNGDVYYKTGGAWAVVYSLAGSQWYTGAGAPSGGLGVNRDLYLNTTTGEVYYKSAGSWGVVADITGPTGATGAPGTNGSGVNINVGEDGVTITASPRPLLNFTGNVTVTDNPGASRVDIDVPVQQVPGFLLMAQGII